MGLNQPSVTEREEPPVTKDHVVQDTYAQHFAGFFESARDFLIFWTRRRFAAWVVVNKNHSSRAQM